MDVQLERSKLLLENIKEFQHDLLTEYRVYYDEETADTITKEIIQRHLIDAGIDSSTTEYILSEI